MKLGKKAVQKAANNPTLVPPASFQSKLGENHQGALDYLNNKGKWVQWWSWKIRPGYYNYFNNIIKDNKPIYLFWYFKGYINHICRIENFKTNYRKGGMSTPWSEYTPEVWRKGTELVIGDQSKLYRTWFLINEIKEILTKTRIDYFRQVMGRYREHFRQLI